MHYYGGLLSDKDTLFELRMFSAVRRYIQILWKHTADEVRSSRLRVTLKAQAFSFVSTLCLLRWVACLLFMLICALSDEALHKTLNAVFQDFVPYSLTVRENVATGDIEKLHNDQALQSALERAHAADFINNHSF